jgi:hypothetical protein
MIMCSTLLSFRCLFRGKLFTSASEFFVKGGFEETFVVSKACFERDILLHESGAHLLICVNRISKKLCMKPSKVCRNLKHEQTLAALIRFSFPLLHFNPKRRCSSCSVHSFKMIP